MSGPEDTWTQDRENELQAARRDLGRFATLLALEHSTDLVNDAVDRMTNLIESEAEANRHEGFLLGLISKLAKKWCSCEKGRRAAARDRQFLPSLDWHEEECPYLKACVE